MPMHRSPQQILFVHPFKFKTRHGGCLILSCQRSGCPRLCSGTVTSLCPLLSGHPSFFPLPTGKLIVCLPSSADACFPCASRTKNSSSIWYPRIHVWNVSFLHSMQHGMMSLFAGAYSWSEHCAHAERLQFVVRSSLIVTKITLRSACHPYHPTRSNYRRRRTHRRHPCRMPPGPPPMCRP